jgi:hypothetical protein
MRYSALAAEGTISHIKRVVAIRKDPLKDRIE